jgi:ABC-type uncharacterized transport system substrate-binding protein
MMQKFVGLIGGVVAGLLMAGTAAVAHPHVFVTMKSEVVYAPDGSVTGIKHAWSFDDMFSSYSTQGLESKEKGVFTREELAPLAEVNVTSLKEYDFFTYAKVDGKKVDLADPAGGAYWLEYKDSVLTLNFTLPLKKPVKAKDFSFEIYDPSYFVDFGLADKDPVTLAHAPAGCTVSYKSPKDATAPTAKLGESFFNNPANADNWGAQFANKVAVKCP